MFQHSFSVDLGAKYGVYEALFLANLYFWLKINLSKGQQILDKNVWAEFPLKKVMERQPYFTESSLRTVVKNLKNSGMILLSKRGGKNVLSYTLTEIGWKTMLEKDMTKDKNLTLRKLKELNTDKLNTVENNICENHMKSNSFLLKIREQIESSEYMHRKVCRSFGTTENFIENIIGPSIEKHGKNIVDRAFENFMRKASKGGSYSLVATFYEEIKYICEK